MFHISISFVLICQSRSGSYILDIHNWFGNSLSLESVLFHMDIEDGIKLFLKRIYSFLFNKSRLHHWHLIALPPSSETHQIIVLTVLLTGGDRLHVKMCENVCTRWSVSVEIFNGWLSQYIYIYAIVLEWWDSMDDRHTIYDIVLCVIK